MAIGFKLLVAGLAFLVLNKFNIGFLVGGYLFLGLVAFVIGLLYVWSGQGCHLINFWYIIKVKMIKRETLKTATLINKSIKVDEN